MCRCFFRASTDLFRFAFCLVLRWFCTAGSVSMPPFKRSCDSSLGFTNGCNDPPVLLAICLPYRPITHIVLVYHNVNKTCLLISSNMVIRGPGWRCYSTNICEAMHHLRPRHSPLKPHGPQWPPPLPPANVNYHISP